MPERPAPDVPEPPAPDVVVRLGVAAVDAETAAGRLWEAGATAVEWRDAPDRSRVELVAGLPTPGAARAVAAELGGDAVELTDRSWQDAWRAHARPVVVADNLVVAPAWRTVDAGAATLSIDPGPCFGSGSHPSTRLLLAALADEPPVGQRVLDVGTGSGVLAVAAARLGAAEVVAIDIDPDAVTVTLANAARNGVADRVRASTDPVATAARDITLALVNVTAGVHAELADEVGAALAPGGTARLAGLLPGQWRHVADAYRGLEVVGHPTLDGWEGVILRRPAG